NGILYRKNLLWIPKDPAVKRSVLQSEHDSKVAGHFGQDKTIELIRRNFWWPHMDEEIIEYVRTCPECQKNKSRRHRPYGMLQPLELSYAPWKSIAMDFITDLPLSGPEGHNQRWVVIDRFTKMAHSIPLRNDQKDADVLARTFLQ